MTGAGRSLACRAWALRGIARALLFAATLAGLATGPAAAQGSAHIEASMLAETAAPEPGTTTRIAIRMVPERGWHGYWSNPGDSGLPVEATWTTPEGVNIGPLRHPAPALLQLAGLTSYVHRGSFTLLADMTLARDIAPGSDIPLRADVTWLACSDTLCVPEHATLELSLTLGKGAPLAASARLFRAAEAALPVGNATKVEAQREGRSWHFVITGAPRIDASSARLFPAEDGWFAASAPQRLERSDNGAWQIAVAASGPSVPGPFRGVFADGQHSYALDAEARPSILEPADTGLLAPPASSAGVVPRAAARPAGSVVPPSSATPNAFAGFWAAVGGAALGGLLLASLAGLGLWWAGRR